MTALPDFDLGRDDDTPIFNALVGDYLAADAAMWAATHCAACFREVAKRADGSPVRHKNKPYGDWCGGAR